MASLFTAKEKQAVSGNAADASSPGSSQQPQVAHSPRELASFELRPAVPAW